MAEVDTDFFADLVKIATEFFGKTTNELDQYTTRKSEIKVESDRIILLTPSHIQFAKYGRGPGKKPPLDSILEWVKGRGIIIGDTDEEGTAFIVQAKIGKEGTSNWVPNAPNALEEALNKNYEQYNKEIGNVMAVKISDEVNKIYKEILPDKEFKY